MTRLNIQIIYDNREGRVGPGKIRLLELLRETGSISAAARAMSMSYRQAWLKLDEINALYGHKLFDTAQGGQGHGGATLTPTGEELIADYRRFEAETLKLIDKKYSILDKPARKH
ncbi:MAG TPA: LysR family transcriptional regulator [Candidatus Acidoferrum sp.]|nr:LysR family transcriptional regulator [Candidatus Acidoferrum sp.]